MDLLTPALHGAAARPLRARRAGAAALVVGAGGALGSALLAAALGSGRCGRVLAVVTGPMQSTLQALVTLPAAALDGPPLPLGVDTAFIVFERARHANGRDDAFLQPAPAELPRLAAALHAGGVRRLLVVVPHAPALLPQALKAGLASLDEAAVAALGFEHLVFLRAAAYGSAAAGPASALQRFADWWLAQLRWMVPQREQPLRAARVGELAVELALRLPAAAPGTRVLPPELLWEAAQAADAGAVFDAWLGVAAARQAG